MTSSAGPGTRQVALTRRDLAELLRDLTSRGVVVTLTVTGCSMHPAIRSGDVVTVEPVGATPVPIGTVVAAEAPEGGGLVVHRVIGRSGTNVLLRGDNATLADGEVPESAVIGIVARVERAGRLLRRAPAGFRGPFAALVRAGVVRRLNRLRGQARSCVPSALLAVRERRR